MEGEDKILRHQEYANVEKIKEFLSVVTKKDKIFNLLTEDNKDIKINIKIGDEGYEDIPKDCSVVSATYTANGKKLGTYGVIGPSRMDYQKVIAVLENVGAIIESILLEKDK
jgi:heat-inducible transcriptional repressor